MADPVRIQWELHTRADLDTTWLHLSDTDRFNRVAELGFTFTEAPDDSGEVVRVGHMNKLGLSLSWDELRSSTGRPTGSGHDASSTAVRPPSSPPACA
ncbi:MAG: hypothetical protein GY913_07715 [Proteobacteria bacterium]|nr:hypothetical protein [Pseudomonadota bacterium]MCP4916798.1 hypothetical protein [Pseudomonadota bacterium]